MEKQYIDKDKVMEKIKMMLQEEYSCDNSNEETGYHCALHELQYFLNTLETKEMDLENSMVCNVSWYDGFLLDYTQEQQDALLEKIGATYGDKIRVILIKE